MFKIYTRHAWWFNGDRLWGTELWYVHFLGNDFAVFPNEETAVTEEISTTLLPVSSTPAHQESEGKI